MTPTKHHNEAAQAETPYFSTLALEKLLLRNDCIKPGTEILDLGTGLGSNLIYLGQRYPQTRFHGIDYSVDKIALGQAKLGSLNLGNVTLQAGDWFKLPATFQGRFDGVFSVHTLCVFKHLKPAFDAVTRLEPRWIALNALFYDGPLDVLIHIRDHSNPALTDDNPDSDFNVFSLDYARTILSEAGYDVFAEPFFPPVPLPAPPGGARGTFTISTEWSPHTQFSGPVHLPWHLVLGVRR